MEKDDRIVLRCMVKAATPMRDEQDLSYTNLEMNKDALENLLVKEAGMALSEASKAAARMASELGLRVWKTGPLELEAGRRKLKIPRTLLGEALGALASDLMPTRRRAILDSRAAAREIMYFGGDAKARLPILAVPGKLARLAAGSGRLNHSGRFLFIEDRPLQTMYWGLTGLLSKDPRLPKPPGDDKDIKVFQQKLREDPLDGRAVMKLRDYYSKRITVGFRDTIRWALGSRHPWFGWDRARHLITSSFEHYGSESFLPSFLRIYTYDLNLDEERLSLVLARNRKAASRLADVIRPQLSARTRQCLDPGNLHHVCASCLDYHYDAPDYEVEARGRLTKGVTVGFAAKAAVDGLRRILGMEAEPRRNTNFKAFFEAVGLDRELLGNLDRKARDELFRVMEDTFADQAGPIGEYERPAMVLYTIYQKPVPRPEKKEETLDSFSLAEAKAPQHAVHLARSGEIIEKLVVFFTLVLRHYLDTGYVPDLMPSDKFKDYMLLGLWGHNTRNLRINVYQRDDGTTRSEIFFTGKGQTRRYMPDEEGISEAAVARLMTSRLDPLLEPSVLRAMSGFVMALEEFERGSKAAQTDRLSLARHAVEVYRETMRNSLKGTLVDLATLLEVLIDNSADLTLEVLNKFEPLLKWRLWNK